MKRIAMRRTIFAALLTVVALSVGSCATFQGPQQVTTASSEGITVFSLRGEAVYKEWGGGKAAVKTEDGWLEGSSLRDHSLYDGGKAVFFLFIDGEARKFEF